jgi:hypothetical protein
MVCKAFFIVCRCAVPSRAIEGRRRGRPDVGRNAAPRRPRPGLFDRAVASTAPPALRRSTDMAPAEPGTVDAWRPLAFCGSVDKRRIAKPARLTRAPVSKAPCFASAIRMHLGVIPCCPDPPSPDPRRRFKSDTAPGCRSIPRVTRNWSMRRCQINATACQLSNLAMHRRSA